MNEYKVRDWAAAGNRNVYTKVRVARLTPTTILVDEYDYQGNVRGQLRFWRETAWEVAGRKTLVPYEGKAKEYIENAEAKAQEEANDHRRKMDLLASCDSVLPHDVATFLGYVDRAREGTRESCVNTINFLIRNLVYLRDTIGEEPGDSHASSGNWNTVGNMVGYLNWFRALDDQYHYANEPLNGTEIRKALEKVDANDDK